MASQVVVPTHEDPLATVPLQARVEFQALAVVVAVWANATEKADASTPKLMRCKRARKRLVVRRTVRDLLRKGGAAE